MTNHPSAATPLSAAERAHLTGLPRRHLEQIADVAASTGFPASGQV